jgi:hypothetical protein
MICLLLSGCGLKALPELRPANRVFSYMPKNDMPEYTQGWQEGCESGMSGMTNSFYSSFYTFKQDKTMMKNEIYYKAWKDSYDYCKGFVYGILKEADLRRPLSNSWSGGIITKKKGFIDWLDNSGPSSLFRW